MKVIVIGGGKVGYYLIKELRSKKHDVVLIEKDKDVCTKIAEELDIDVINGEGTDLEVLKDADIEVADIVAAVTGKDEENLVMCKVAKNNFDIQQTIARVNNPKNEEVFKELGVDNTVCSTQVISNLVQWECQSDQIRIIQIFDRGEMVLVEVNINKKTSWCDKYIKDINMAEDSVIASIFRYGHIIYPKGDVMIKDEDKVLLVTDKKNIISQGKHKSILEKIVFN